MKRTAVLNVVGLTEGLLGSSTPRINAFVSRGRLSQIEPAFPAVTCTAQSSYLTGANPNLHGVVGNGWYNRELSEVQFWKQSNHLVYGRKLWEDLRDLEAGFTCAKLFWWYNMYSTADYSLTPRPIYPADGRKFFDVYSWPYDLRPAIKKELGDFPFATFWGPAAGLASPQGSPDAATRWIAESAKWVETKKQPTLSLVYLPHLDYNLQRVGPGHPSITRDLLEIDNIVGELIDFYSERGVQVVLLSEYGITDVQKPVFINRIFRQEGWLTIKDELGLEILDCGACQAFAVADHQVAHIYLNDSSLEPRVRALLEKTAGVERVLNRVDQAAWGIDHQRAGDLVAIADEHSWFAYYYWLDEQAAPDFARCVDIHRKPGYDPVELFLDPALKAPKLKIAFNLLKKQLGFRMLMDLIPLDASLVKGSHGRRPAKVSDYPVIVSSRPELVPHGPIPAADIYHALKRHILH